MALKTVAEIRDPVHGYIKITEVEREVIDSPVVQRLRRIHQLAGAYLVYPGAVHTRFEHVIGTMHVAGAVAESLAERYNIKDDQIQEIRLAALLHDVGHGPFSHMFEEVLAEKADITHEDITQLVVSKTLIGDILEKHGFSSRKMSTFAIGNELQRPQFMNEIISGGLSADIMDYLSRDSYFTGVEYGQVDIHRIINSLHVAERRLAIEKAALYAFEAMLLARYEMFKTVYFHRTVRAAQLMLVHSMKLADDTLHLTDISDIDHYLELTDEVVLQRLATLEADNRNLKEARRLANDFRNRKLVKCVYEKPMERKDRTVERLFKREDTRNRVLLDISRTAKVDRMHIYLDVPTAPSIPYTSSREMLTSIITVSNDDKETHREIIPISRLPLVGSIAGFMNILRIYTQPENRGKVSRATSKLFGNDESVA